MAYDAMARRSQLQGQPGSRTPFPFSSPSPGNLSRALGCTLRGNGGDLTAGALTIEPPDQPREFRVSTGPRIGITKAVERPLRFWVAGNRFVSGAGQAGRRATQTPG